MQRLLRDFSKGVCYYSTICGPRGRHLEPRILSIQSHVVAGYVGNKAVTFPLQLLGFEVDGINSVQFSNHTHYKVCKGNAMEVKELDQLMKGIHDNHLNIYSHVLTGFIETCEFLKKIACVICDLKKVNPRMIYCCDPVMGDRGKMYVEKDVLPIYRDIMLSMCDILTPNQYEAELLSGVTIKCMTDLWDVVDCFHERGVKIVVVTSTELAAGHSILACASHIKQGKKERVIMEFPKVKANFVGTGDLFAGVFLAWMYKSNNDIKKSFERAIATVQRVMHRTIRHSKTQDRKWPRDYELRLIHSKKDIEYPKITCRAKYVCY